jgi:hypothetical protein
MKRRDILVGGGGMAVGALGLWAFNNGALDDVAGDASAAATGTPGTIETASLPGVSSLRYEVRNELPGVAATFATDAPDSVAVFGAGGSRIAGIDPAAGEDWMQLSWPVAGTTAFQVQSIRGDARETVGLGTGMSISVSNEQYVNGRVTADATYQGPAPVFVSSYGVRSRAGVPTSEAETLATNSPMTAGDTFGIDVPWSARVADLFVVLRQSRETVEGAAVEKATASLSV